MSDSEEYKKYILRNSKASLSRLVVLHKTFAAFVPFRAGEAQKDGNSFLGFSDDGAMCLLTTATVMTRHISAIRRLLSARYPIQALILLRALIEAWFYTVMYFEEPQRADDYLKNPANSKGKNKYRPFEVKEIALRVVRSSPVPEAEELAIMIVEQYKIACEMVHMSDPLMYASFGVFSGEDKIPFDISSENDKYLYIAYGRVLQVSSAFWLVLLLTFLQKDNHPFTSIVMNDIDKFVRPALKFVWGIDSEKFEQMWSNGRSAAENC